MLSSDPVVVQVDVVVREVLSESRGVEVWEGQHRNQVEALVGVVPSYLDAYPLGDRMVLLEGHPWVEEAFQVEVVLSVDWIRVDAPYQEVPMGALASVAFQVGAFLRGEMVVAPVAVLCHRHVVHRSLEQVACACQEVFQVALSLEEEQVGTHQVEAFLALVHQAWS